MTAKEPIGTIAVAGGGIVGFSAALAFARALPKARVQLIDLPADPAALADRLPGTMPAIRHFHRLVGIGEPELVRQAQATYRVGTRFEDWPETGRAWHHCFGRTGAHIDASPFHHQWMRLRSEPGALDYDAYSPAVALAKAGKFVHPAEDQNVLLGAHDYALRLDPDLYRGLLRNAAARARVAVRPGRLADVVVGADGSVEALRLADGGEVRADLFIDCAGPEAPILSRLDDGFEDWSEYLPCDRLVLRWAEGEVPGPLDRARANDDGYEFTAPLASRALHGQAFSAALSGASGGGSELIAFRPGRRSRSWVRNVVAFGDAAVTLDPLESSNLFLAQNAIRRAVTLIPDRDFQPLVLAEFNRRTAAEADRVRDFVALHFLLAKRSDGEFWKSMVSRRRPDSLAHTLDQFEGRGRLPKFEEESFTDDSWLAVLIGLGVLSQRLDPTVHRVKKGKAVAMFERIAGACAALPERLPAYPAYLAQLTRG